MFGFHCCKGTLLTRIQPTIHPDRQCFPARLFSSWCQACGVVVVPYQALDFPFTVAELHEVFMRSVLLRSLSVETLPIWDRLKASRSVCSVSSFRLLLKMLAKFNKICGVVQECMYDKNQCWKSKKVTGAKCSEASCGKGFVKSPHRRVQVLLLELLKRNEFKRKQ